MNKLAIELAKLDALLKEPPSDLIGMLSKPVPSGTEMAKRIARQEQAEYDFEEAFWDRQNGREEEAE